MKITVFSGTTEGRELSRLLAGRGHQVTVSVASEYGREEQGLTAGIVVVSGRKQEMDIRKMLQGQDLLVDATHPYADHITGTLRRVCRKMDLPYLRLLRPGSSERVISRENRILTAGSAEEAAGLLVGTDGPVLLTTGSKELSAYAGIERPRLFVRVLPSLTALKICEGEGIPHRNIIAMQGPFSKEMNLAMLHQYGIRWMVTKDSGKEGGFDAKLEAAAETDCTVIILRRPEDTGLTMEGVLEEVGRMEA